MNLLKLLLKLAVFGVASVAALTVVNKVRQRSAGSSAGTPVVLAGEKLSEAGFLLLKPEEAQNPNVTIMSPPHCPSTDARRARALGDSLARAGIPHEMKSEISFTLTDPKEAERVQQFMGNVANPLVLVRGWAKGNPTLDQVIAQYRAGK